VPLVSSIYKSVRIPTASSYLFLPGPLRPERDAPPGSLKQYYPASAWMQALN
jgi:hypothetical protein